MRGLNIPPYCSLCNADVESIIHTLRDCRHARDFWNSFPPPIQSNLFYGTNLLVWLRIIVLLIFIPLWASLRALSLPLVCGVCGLDVTILSSGINTTKRLLWLKQLLKHLSSPFSV